MRLSDSYQYVAFDNDYVLVQVKNAYQTHDVIKFDSYLERCYDENKSGIRKTIVAVNQDEVAAIAHLVFHSRYPYFKDKGLPEISDLMVFKPYRKHGVATNIIQILETYAISKGHQEIGICVGLYKDYGSAQKLYSRLGYVLDGQGLVSHDEYVKPGDTVLVDDDLNMCFIKKL